MWVSSAQLTARGARAGTQAPVLCSAGNTGLPSVRAEAAVGGAPGEWEAVGYTGVFITPWGQELAPYC